MAKTAMLEATTTEKSSTQDEKQKNLETMVKYGEVLSNELIEMLSQYGNSYQGLCIETYAVCKAYATLKAIAQNANWDNEPLFQKLLPWFIDEAKQMVSEVSTQMSNH
ncbi:hypothetical protein [uncultured Prevotella sp.]|uniref:hypothetical protein n=1 Tax=uncultured Prevotella sp. TaxID=159272 RepID=UPI0025825913|nr:hypothetical protein [uncultured Prevotella sp.]